MRKVYCLLLVFYFTACLSAFAQDGGVSIGKGQNAAHTKAILELFSQDKGLLIPRMDSAQRNSMFLSDDLSAKGMLVFDTDDNNFFFWSGTDWSLVGNELQTLSGDSFPSDALIGQVFYNTSTSLVSVFTGTEWERINFDIINDLTSGGASSALSAEQGKILKDLVDANTAKIGITDEQAIVLAATSGTNTGDQDISGIVTNASAVSTLQTEQSSQNTAIAANTAKTGITAAQAAIIAATSGTNTGDQDISGILTNANAISSKLTGNSSITGATHTKITYDAKGLVTAGEAATTADIAASTDKNYLTDAEQILIGYISGTNTGDQDISGIAINSNDIGLIKTEQSTQNDAIVLNTANILANAGAVDNHINDVLNPHNVSTDQLGLANVDNTSDLLKPISTATQTALNLKENAANKSVDIGLGSSNVLFPTQKAVKTYVDNLALGLNWQNPVEFINTIGDVSSPAPAVHTDGYIIAAGGNIGDWSIFSPGDLVQYQTDHWVLVKSLNVGDFFGVAFKSSTSPVGGLSGKKNQMVEITGGTPGAFTYTFTDPNNNDALFVQNANAYYHNVTYSYSESLAQWVQLSASVNFTFDNGLQTVGNVISLGDLSSDWNQNAAFDITTAGGITLLNANDIRMTGSLGETAARLEKGWFTDLEVTNAIEGSVTGNAATVTTNADLTGHIVSNGNLTQLGSFTSENLSSALSDESGIGAAVFNNSPVFVGTPSLPTGTIAVTQTAGDNSTAIATTAYADAAIGLNTSDIATNKAASEAADIVLQNYIDAETNRALSVETVLSTISSDNKSAIIASNILIADNTAKTGITTSQANEITANTAKIAYSDALVALAPAVVANTAKVGYTDAAVTNVIAGNPLVAANTAKTGITSSQASEITVNSNKLGYSDALVSANTSVVANSNQASSNLSSISAIVIEQGEQNAVIGLNTAKVGYTDVLVSANSTVVANSTKANNNASALGAVESEQLIQNTAIALNTAKVGYTEALVSANASVVANANKAISNASAISTITTEQGVQNSAIALNTAKEGYTDAAVTNVIASNLLVAANTAKAGITTSQANEITANTAKVGYTDVLVSLAPTVVANTAKVGYTDDAVTNVIASDLLVAANTAKIGITSSQANEITVNSNKVGYTEALVSANSSVVANANKAISNANAIDVVEAEQITQDAAIALNTAKVGYTEVLVSANTSVVSNANNITSNTNAIDLVEAEQITQNAAIGLNTAKVGYTEALVSANASVVANTSKAADNTTAIGVIVGEQDEQNTAIGLNTAKVSYTDAAVVAAHISNVLNPHAVTALQVGADPVGSAANVLADFVAHRDDMGNPHTVTAAQVGLGSVDNTSDELKPISGATQTALNLKENTENKSSDIELGVSNVLYPTQNAVKTYVDNLELGLNWQNPVEFINTIGEANAPITPAVHTDGYIIATGGNVGDWSTFSPGDLVQYQTDHWVLVKSLAVGDYFGVAFKSSTTPVGGLSGKKNKMVEITGGTPGAFSYAFTEPVKNDALFVQNPNAYYHNVTYSYSVGLAQWVQLSASVNFTFDNGLNTIGNTISLGDLTSDWNQTGAFDITTAGGLTLLGGNNINMTGSLGETGSRLSKGWFTDLEVTNAIVGSVSGNAATVTTNANLTGHITSIGNDTQLGSFTSLNLSSALSDESGTGVTVFNNSPVFIGTPTLPTGTVAVTQTVGDNSTAIATTAYADAAIAAVNSSSVGALALKANIASPTFTGVVSGITSTMVGLGNVDNTSDLLKPVSTATQTALDLKLDKNPNITGGTNTKITYDTKGLVTSSEAATTADIAASTDRNYISDAQQIILANTSGTNTGDQDLSAIVTNTTSIGTKLTANADITGGTNTKITYDAKGLVTAGESATTADIAVSADKNYVSDAQQTVLINTSGTNTGDQDLSGIGTNATAISTKLTANSNIVGGTNTKITYDAKGLVTSSEAATTADIAASTDKNYVSDAQQTVLANTSGVNTGNQDVSGIAINTSDVSTLQAEQTIQNIAIALNTAKTGYTEALVSANVDVVANTAKVGITSGQANEITANTAKTSYTDAAAVALNTAKTGYTEALVSANANVVANTAKVGISPVQASAITANTVKISYTDAAAVALNSAKISYTDASVVALNTAKVGYSEALVSANSDVVANTAKVGISPVQASAIVANTAKISYTDAAAVALNTAKVGLTPVQATVISNTSGTNTGDQSLSIVGNNLTISGGNTVVIPSVGSSTRSYVNTYITSATNTYLNTTNVAEKLLGITADIVPPVNFTSSANTLTYTGTTTQVFTLVCSISLTGDRRETYTFFIAKNGLRYAGSEVERYMSSTTDVGALSVSSMISLSTGDRVEIWAEGDRGTITIQTMNILLHN